MARVVHPGVVAGDDVPVIESIRIECYHCPTKKPNKTPKILFTGLLDGDAAISIKCSQCGGFCHFGTENVIAA